MSEYNKKNPQSTSPGYTEATQRMQQCALKAILFQYAVKKLRTSVYGWFRLHVHLHTKRENWIPRDYHVGAGN